MSSKNIDIAKIQLLIQEAQNINWNGLVEEPTFMDIAGFPHYENVCSNILAFFLQTDAEHGMKDLLLKALLNAMNINNQHEYVTNEVTREVMTGTSNRIDLVISTDDFVVAIENKIFAPLYNDLKDYSNYIESNYTTGAKYKVVLSVLPVEPKNLTDGFINVTYQAFLNEIDNLMGQYWKDTNPKYLIMLNDFVKNLRKLNGGNQMNQDVLDYFAKNREEIESLMVDVKSYKVYLRETVTTLAERLNINNVKTCKLYYYRESNALFDDLVLDISIDDAVIAIDTLFHSEKYSIRIWLRNPGKISLKDKSELSNFLVKKGFDQNDLVNKRDRHVYNKDFFNQQDVADKLNDIIKNLC